MKKNGKNSKAIGIITIILFVLDIILAIGFVTLVIVKTDDLVDLPYHEEHYYVDSQDDDPTTFDNYVYSHDYDFSIGILDGFDEAYEGELNDSADIELYNDSNSTYLIVLGDSKLDYTLPYADFKEGRVASIEEIYDVTLGDFNKIDYAYGNMEYTDFSLVEDGLALSMRYYLFETDNYYGQILVWTVNSNKAYLDEVDRMATSLAEF